MYSRPERAARYIDVEDTYAHCENLLLKVDHVIVDQLGTIIKRQPAKTYSEIFNTPVNEKKFVRNIT